MNTLFESSKALSGLPKHWIKYLANRYGTGAIADLAGKHSEIIPLKKFEKGLVSKMLKNESNLAVVGKLDNAPIFMIVKHPQKTTRYMFFTTKKGDGYYDNFGNRVYSGGRRRSSNVIDHYTFDEIYRFIETMQKDISFDDLNVYAITKDPYRKELAQKRYTEKTKKDPLQLPKKTPYGYEKKVTVAQKQRAEKYAGSKKVKLDRVLDIQIENFKKQINSQLDSAFEKIINSIKKGETWNISKKEIGSTLMDKIDLTSIEKLAELYKILDVRYDDTDALEVIDKLRRKAAGK